MSFSPLNRTPDGEKNTAYQHLQENTLPTPNWIDKEQNSPYDDMPIQLTFRHAESWQNTVDANFNAQYQALKGEHWDSIPETLFFPLITEYIIAKIQSGDDEEIDITERWAEDCKSVNKALIESINDSNREIRHVAISPKRRNRQTATEILKWIVHINDSALTRNGSIETSWVKISLNPKIAEQDFWVPTGFYYSWARWYLQNSEHRRHFQEWCKSDWKSYFQNLSESENQKFLQIISNNKKPEDRESISKRIRLETESLLNLTDGNWIAVMITHAWMIQALTQGIINQGRKSEWPIHHLETPKNTGMTVIGKSRESGLLLMWYNLLPSQK